MSLDGTPKNEDFGLGTERWVSVREAARAAAVDPRTIRRWADTGRIRGRRTPGGHRQISLDGLNGAYSSTVHRSNPPAGTNRDPSEIIPDWAASVPLWAHWHPPRRLSDDDLESLRLDVAACRRGLDDVDDALTAELHQRDEAAVEAERNRFVY